LPWPCGWGDVWWELQGRERPSDPKLWGLEGGPEVVAFGRASGRKVGDLVVSEAPLWDSDGRCPNCEKTEKF